MIGIDETELNNLIQVFPNPANNFVTIQLPALSKKATIIISNQIGETILKDETSNQSEILNIEQFANGVYTISIQTEFGSVHRKLIKQ